MPEKPNLLAQVSANLNPKKISIVEFAESDEYCGRRLFPRQKVLLKLMFLEELTGKEEDVLSYWIQGGRRNTEIQISPQIRERVQHLRDSGFDHFREVILVGGRRSSKGFVTGIAMAKILHDALQLQDPGKHYDIDPTKNIAFCCIATSEQQAREMQFGDLQNTLEGCQAMQKYIVKSLENEIRIATPADLKKIERAKANRQKSILRDIARLRAKALSSNASSLRGQAVLTACIDEMAHMIPGESRLAADQVYDALTPSFDQFGPGAMLFLNSSPYTRVGKFYEKFAESMELTADGNPKNPLIFGIRYPSWALFEGYQDDPERRFKRAITVSPDWDENRKIKNQYYYSAEDRRNIPIARQEEMSNPEKYKVERRGQFAEVIDAFLNPAQVDRMFEGKPFINSQTGELEHIPLRTNWDNSTNLFRYKAHVDPSTTTAGFGFALGHVEEFPGKDDKPVPHVVFDIVYRWNPKNFEGGVIDWREVMNQIIIWMDIFRPYELTFDQFQSAEPIQRMRQMLNERHIGEVRVYQKTATNEHNWNRANVFRTALYQGLIHAPQDIPEAEYASLELKFLQQMNTAGRYPRVDKQDIGPVQTKDIADCMMEVVNSLIGNMITAGFRESLTDNLMAVGSPGGYRIGGDQYHADPRLSAYYTAGRAGEQRRTGSSPRVGLGKGGGMPGRGMRREWGAAPKQRKLPGW